MISNTATMQPAKEESVEGFRSVSVILPVLNETASLTRTFEQVVALLETEVIEFLIVVGRQTLIESRQICEAFSGKYRGKCQILEQQQPGLGNAIQSGIENARMSHVLVMYSDLESNPGDLPRMIEAAKHNPQTIVSASRWLKGGTFKDYGYGKLILNWGFQKAMALLFAPHVSDFTFGYRIYPAKVLQMINWESNRHPFVLESILKPLLLGITVIEVPAHWERRHEGKSQMTLMKYWPYLWLAMRLRVTSSRAFLKKP